LIRIAEGSKPTTYIDSKGYVTIGIGFNLNSAAIRNRVLAELGISGSQAQVITDICIQEYDESQNDEVKNKLASNGLASLSDTQINNIFNDLVTRFDTTVTNWLRTYRIPTIGNSRERAVLVSLAYNSRVGNDDFPTTLGPKLAQALGGTVNGKTYEANRAEAWYEIRFHTNPSPDTGKDAPGLARRRYAEAQMFGLYDNPNSVTQDEAKQVYRMYQAHRTQMQEYEHLFGTLPNYSAPIRGDRIAAANSDFGSFFGSSGLGSVPVLEVALNLAKTALFGDLLTRYAGVSELAGRLADPDVKSTNIYLNPQKPSDTDRTSVLDARSYEMGSYEASGAKDVMIGMDQKDVLYGGK